ncbi:MAG: O-antigen ligase family protein, partial [Patescibacteria group bacterium]
ATRATGDGRLEVKSNQERLASYSESWQLIKIHPIVGSGLGNYTAAVYNRLDNRLPAWAYQPTHNLYLLVLAETGAVGLMMLFVICYLLFATKGTWTIKAALASLLFLGLFDHWLWSLYFGGMLWWLVAGLTVKKD